MRLLHITCSVLMFSICKSTCCRVLSYTGSCQHELGRFASETFINTISRWWFRWFCSTLMVLYRNPVTCRHNRFPDIPLDSASGWTPWVWSCEFPSSANRSWSAGKSLPICNWCRRCTSGRIATYRQCWVKPNIDNRWVRSPWTLRSATLSGYTIPELKKPKSCNNSVVFIIIDCFFWTPT